MLTKNPFQLRRLGIWCRCGGSHVLEMVEEVIYDKAHAKSDFMDIISGCLGNKQDGPLPSYVFRRTQD